VRGIEQALSLNVGVIVCALRTVRAIFRAAAGFYGDELARPGRDPADETGGGMGLRAKKQVRKRRAIDGLDLGFGPIKAQ